MEEPVEIQEKEELIITLAITGHGCEDFRDIWDDTSDISQYFKHNVRVYSNTCFPDIPCISSNFMDVINSVEEQMGRELESETLPIMQEYIVDKCGRYQSTLENLERINAVVTASPDFKKTIEKSSMSCNFSTYLANKYFRFNIDESRGRLLDEQIRQTTGIILIDLRKKLTDSAGNVTYENLFSLKRDKGRLNLSYFNLTYQSGIQYFLKDILKIKPKKELLRKFNEIFKLLNFIKSSQTIDNLSLDQLYEFFIATNIRYVNILDFTCRVCSDPSNRLTDEERELQFDKEQLCTYMESNKHNLGSFGGSKNKTKKRSKKNKRSKKKRQKPNHYK